MLKMLHGAPWAYRSTEIPFHLHVPSVTVAHCMQVWLPQQAEHATSWVCVTGYSYAWDM